MQGCLMEKLSKYIKFEKPGEIQEISVTDIHLCIDIIFAKSPCIFPETSFRTRFLILAVLKQHSPRQRTHIFYLSLFKVAVINFYSRFSK